MFAEVWNRVVEGKYQSIQARLAGYRRLKITNEIYPGLFPGKGEVDGIVYFDITADDMARLDGFEADCYERVAAMVIDESGAQIPVETYRISESHRNILAFEEWDPVKFKQSGLQEFLSGYHGFKQQDE
jgi:gamma-glutamylcyclotransferase (GGCT)/AIG2-like uncharacterized protein YtfP